MAIRCKFMYFGKKYSGYVTGVNPSTFYYHVKVNKDDKFDIRLPEDVVTLDGEIRNG